MAEIKGTIDEVLELSKNNTIEKEVKRRTFELIQYISDHYKKPSLGLIVVLGFQESYVDEKILKPCKKDYFASENEDQIPDNIYQKAIEKIPSNISDPGIEDRLIWIINKQDDGALLIEADGTIKHNGYKIIADDAQILDALLIPNDCTLGKRYGFDEDEDEEVGMRHTSAAACAIRIPHATIFVRSEETGRTRMIEYRTIYQMDAPIKQIEEGVEGYTQKNGILVPTAIAEEEPVQKQITDRIPTDRISIPPEIKKRFYVHKQELPMQLRS